MKLEMCICDVCFKKGEIKRAIIEYEGKDEKLFHACEKHAITIEWIGFKITKHFSIPGLEE